VLGVVAAPLPIVPAVTGPAACSRKVPAVLGRPSVNAELDAAPLADMVEPEAVPGRLVVLDPAADADVGLDVEPPILPMNQAGTQPLSPVSSLILTISTNQPALESCDVGVFHPSGSLFWIRKAVKYGELTCMTSGSTSCTP
jgi:hypothetical protein